MLAFLVLLPVLLLAELSRRQQPKQVLIGPARPPRGLRSYPGYLQASARLDQIAAAGLAVGFAAAALLAVERELWPIGAAAGLATAASLLAAVRSGRRAKRAKVGAESERRVAEALAPLAAVGWSVRHNLPWPPHGDIDHVAISPYGPAFVIETKTATFTESHVARTREAADCVRRLRSVGKPVVPVIVVCRADEPTRWLADTLVVSVNHAAVALADVARWVVPRRRARGSINRN